MLNYKKKIKLNSLKENILLRQKFEYHQSEIFLFHIQNGESPNCNLNELFCALQETPLRDSPNPHFEYNKILNES